MSLSMGRNEHLLEVLRLAETFWMSHFELSCQMGEILMPKI
jgi:hypothetical protein